MADLYAKPSDFIETGYNPEQQQAGGVNKEVEEYLNSLPLEERDAARQRLMAPPTGEEIAMMVDQDETYLPTIEQFDEIEKWHKTKEVGIFDGLGTAAEMVFNEFGAAFGSATDKPLETAQKLPATVIEAFMQGTRAMYGMAAQSQNPDSAFFRVKDFLNGTGTREDRYNQYLEALDFNRKSKRLMEGKETLVMDKDLINPEVTQAMSYIADPSLFIPFGKVASAGARAVGMGEKLTLAAGRATAIKNKIIGGAIKWGAGQPLEFLGGAVRNTIDFGLEKAGDVFETATGMEAKEFARTARLSGIGVSAAGVAGHSIPYANAISDAYFTAGAGRGLGEALTAVGETMGKSPFERGINSWAREALEQANKSGTPLSKQAQGLLKALDAVDPMFAYSYAVAEGAAQGMAIGGTLGYLSGGEEGLYQGMGAGLALGTMGAGAGKVVSDVTGGTGVARRAVQAKMVIEGKKVTDPETATALQALQSAAESRGKDVDFVNGIIAGIDNLAPNTVLHALTVDQFKIEAVKQGYNPETGRFAETQNLVDLSEFGDNRQMRGRTTAFLRLLGGSFAGDADKLLRLSKDARFQTKLNERIKTQFNTLSEFEKDFVVRELKRQKSLIDSGKKKASDFRADYEAVSWGESWTAEIIKKYGTDAEGAKRDIKSILDDETVNGNLTRRGRVLKDRLRAEGFLSRNGDILSERNLHDADMTSGVFDKIKGAVVTREADGKTHLYLNLERFGDETFPHELFHAIFRDSPMKHQFVDSLAGKLLGVRDEKGNLIKEPEIAPSELKRFFKRYIEKTTYNQDGSFNREAADRMYKLVENGLAEYEATGDLKKISDSTRQLLNKYTEEFGAYYFSNWIMGKNRNYLFYGGELRGIAGIIDSVKENWLDFWQSKISSANPSFDFSKGVNEAFAKGGSVGRISAIDIWMRDMVRANANSLRGAFNPDTMSADNARQFYRSNGIRNIADSNGRPLQVNKQTAESRRLGREAFKILNGLDPTLRTTRTTLDTDGKQVITGRFSDAELDALVRGGIVPRAWADKVRQGYAMVDGTMPNVASFGYLGKTEQIGDYSWPRKTGKDVAFKNRKAIVFDVETKVRADGTFYTLFHTLDKAVIEQRGNDLWRNAEIRKLWNDDRGAMEADFFNYLNNASKASTDNTKVDSAILLEKGDGLGAKRRDAMHQMAGMALQEGDSYRHKPMAEIPQGIRHSVTTFNVDGMTTLRIDKTERYNVDMNNAHKFIRENWQPDDMKSEKTPNGMAFTHASGYKFLRTDDGKVSAYSNDGSRIGTFGSLKEATDKARSTYNKVLENTRKTAQKMQEYDRNRSTSFQPIGKDTVDEAFEKGDLFKTARIQQIVGNSKLVRQSFDEFLGQRIEEISKGKDEAERGAILSQLFNEDFKELIELEKELQKNLDEFSLEARTLQAQEQEIISRIVEFGQEKKRLQQFSDPDARVDVGILEMYERIYKRKEEVVRRMSEISNKMHNEGITDANSHYYIVKRFLEKFNETGKLSDEAIKFVLTPRLIKEYESQFQTGQPVSFVANHGTPNYELMASRTFNTEFLGRNTGSMSAFNATFFAGSKETSVNYVGNPIKMSWVRDFIDARSFFVEKLPIDVRVKIERLLESDTSKGVVQKVKLLMNNLAKEFPDDFKLVDSSQRTKDGEIIYKPSPTTQRGYYIDSLVDKILEGANDEGWAIGGYEMYWEQAGRKPNLLRTLVKMDNPYVHEYAKADYRDETFASVIKRAKEAGHDGVIFKNTKDGGGIDTIFASFAKNEDNKIFVIETTEDTRFAPRGTDESGRVYKGGSEIEGRSFQPDDYQGGDDYWKPKKNRFESKDEQGFLIRALSVYDEKQNKYLDNPESLDWMDIGHTSDDKVSGMWYVDDVTRKIEHANVSEYPTHEDLFSAIGEENSLKGRIDFPVYKQGKLVKRGRISIAEPVDGFAPDLKGLNELKSKVVKSYNLKSGDVDAYYFGNDETLKNAFGLSSRDQLPIKFQPDESGKETVDPRIKKLLDEIAFQEKIIAERSQYKTAQSVNTTKKKRSLEEAKNRLGSLKIELRNLEQDIKTQEILNRNPSARDVLKERGLSFLPIDEESGKEYGGVHKAPSGEYGEGTLDAMDKTYPSDLYSSVGARYYGSGTPDLDNKAHKLIMNLRGKPDALVTVYRAVPKGVSSSINKGDWVTPLREYAVAHGERWEEGMTIIEKKVKASELYTEGNSLFEFGYSPKQEGKKPKFQPDEIPKEKGTTEIKAGYTRVYHQTTPDNIESIMRKGLLVSKSRPTSESRGVSVSETPFYGDNPNLVTIELQVPTEKLRQANGSALFEDVPASNIIAVHENWHDKARYILNNPETLKEVLNGDMDFMAGDGSPEAKAIEYIKKKYSKEQPKFQPDEGGRTYSEKEMAGEFIGRYAAENPNLIKGKSIMFTKDQEAGLNGGQTYRLSIGNKNEKSGYINVEVDESGKSASVEYTQVDILKQGRGYGNLLYSEMVERLRYLGVKEFSGWITNQDGIPQKIRKRIIDKENARIGGEKTKFYAERGGGRDAISKLEQRAWYEPDEGGRTYSEKEMAGKFIGRYAAENKGIDNGLKLFYGKVPAGMGALGLTLRDKKGEVVAHGQWQRIGDYVMDLDVKVDPKHQGKGYGNLLYSEAVERMRADGVEIVQGFIIDEKQRPVKIRQRIIDKENARIGSKKRTEMVEQIDDEAGIWESGLDKKAWYEPDEDVARKAKNAGYTLKGYHITNADFNVFDLKAKKVNRGNNPAGFYFSTEENSGYQGKRRINAYIKLEKPWDGTFTKSDKEAFKSWFRERFAAQYEGASDTHIAYLDGKMNDMIKRGYFPSLMNGDDATAFLLSRGYDGWKDGSDIAVFKPENIKSAEDFTYDDKGEQIPLSQRFDTTNKDIRFQPSEYEGGDDYYKKSANSFESKDEQGLKIRKAKIVTDKGWKYNPENTSWVEIGHYFGWGKPRDITPSMEMAIMKNSGLWAMNLDDGKFSKINPFTEKERAEPLLKRYNADFKDLTHAMWLDGSPEWKKDYKDKAIGRYELPIYNKENLKRRGKVTISVKRKDYATVSTLNELKTKIAENLNIPRDDFDLYYFDQNKEVKNAFGLSQKDELPVKFQPAEWSDFKTEQSPMGRIIKNAKGYSIMLINNKYRVYNPAKAIIGVYGNEEEAKRRVLRDAPKQ